MPEKLRYNLFLFGVVVVGLVVLRGCATLIVWWKS